MLFRSAIIGVAVVLFIRKVNAQLPCQQCNNPDNGYVPTIDLIQEFHLSDLEEKYELVPGSRETQQAYHLYEYSNLTDYAIRVFPRGIPSHFWFESTFHMSQQNIQPFYLVHITNAQEITQVSIIIDSQNQWISIGLPNANGNVQTVYFPTVQLFDRNWHKIFVSVINDKVRLLLDCNPVLGARGTYEETLVQRRRFDVNNGHVYIARYVDEFNQISNTAQIDLQWMVLGCESTRPPKPNCDELEYSSRPPIGTMRPPIRPSEPNKECPIQCPQGPPGLPGVDGRSIIGAKGERGERGFPGLPGVGIKGEKGEPGQVIHKYEGGENVQGNVIRDVCEDVIKEYLDKLKPSFMGPVGPPGLPGRPGPIGIPGMKGDRGDEGYMGQQGERGEKGEKGDDGRSGTPGAQGMPGVEGIAGPPGRPGERGDDGRSGIPGAPGQPGQCSNDCYYAQLQYVQQLQAQQQQSKGPSPLSYQNFKG